MPNVTPFLWFDANAEEAANFYVSVFKDGKILTVARYTEAGPGPVGSVMTVEFQILGQTFTALNGGPAFSFNESVSFVVRCRTQREVDYYWKKLSSGGGRTSRCGWLKDKYGLSWQVVPTALLDWVTGKKYDPGRTARVMRAMMRMTKLDLRKLKQAAAATR